MQIGPRRMPFCARIKAALLLPCSIDLIFSGISKFQCTACTPDPDAYHRATIHTCLFVASTCNFESIYCYHKYAIMANNPINLQHCANLQLPPYPQPFETFGLAYQASTSWEFFVRIIKTQFAEKRCICSRGFSVPFHNTVCGNGSLLVQLYTVPLTP